MIQLLQPTVTSQWARLGIAFDDDPAMFMPDLERLLLETAREAPRNPRLVTLPASWLVRFGFCVARLRLAALAERELEFRHASVLGYVLEAAQQHMDDVLFQDAVDVCRRRMMQLDREPQPLFERQRSSAALREIAAHESSDLARGWRLWARPFDLREDALQPPRWVFTRNPDLQRRADLQGDLRCTIIETLRHDPDAGASAMELQRHCHLRSYPPILNALGELERSGTIERVAEGVRKRIRLVDPRSAA